MKVKNIIISAGIAAILSQSSFVSFAQPENLEGEVVDYSLWNSIEQIKTTVLEATYSEELEKKCYQGMTYDIGDNSIYKRPYYHYEIFTREIIHHFCDIVVVNGRGSADSCGATYLGKDWENQKMVVVGIKSDSEYPYACAILNEDGTLGSVMGWFKTEQLYPVTNEVTETISATVVTLEDGTTVYELPEGWLLKGTTGIKTSKVKNQIDATEEELVLKFGIKSN